MPYKLILASLMTLFLTVSCGGGNNELAVDESLFDGKWYGPCFNSTVGSVTQSIVINGTSLISTLTTYNNTKNCALPVDGDIVTSEVNASLNYGVMVTITSCKNNTAKITQINISSLEANGNKDTKEKEIEASLSSLTGGLNNSLLPKASSICQKSNGTLLFARQEYTKTLPFSDGRDLIKNPVVYDDFLRSADDLVLVKGSGTTSGHVYTSGGKAHWFDHGRYISNARPGGDNSNLVVIAYINYSRKPEVVAGEFVFTEGKDLLSCKVCGASYSQVCPTTPAEKGDGFTRIHCEEQGQNAVIGVALGGITRGGLHRGFGGGSIQLAIWHDHWRLFAVEDPLQDPYAALASGNFSESLKVNKPYKMSIEYNEADSSAILHLPDGSTTVVQHPYLNKYWGYRFGMQMRRSSLKSGKVEFLRMGIR